jgi:hypothetical protein
MEPTMTDLLIRKARGPGWVIATPRARMRHGEPAIQSDGPRYVSREEALRIVEGFLGGPEPRNGARAPQARLASPKLRPQARQVLDALREYGSLTKRDAMLLDPPCYNLPGRIFELREALGADAVLTDLEEHGLDRSGRHARYRLMPGLSVQIDLLDGAP